jgi:hypothetical protein
LTAPQALQRARLRAGLRFLHMPHCQPGFSSFGFFKWLSFTEGYMVPFDEVLAQGSKQ